MTKISINIPELQLESTELSSFLSSPDAYSDPSYTSKNKRLNELENILSLANLREKLEEQWRDEAGWCTPLVE